MVYKFSEKNYQERQVNPSPVHAAHLIDCENVKHLKWCLADTHNIETKGQDVFLTVKAGKESEAALRRNQYGDRKFILLT